MSKSKLSGKALLFAERVTAIAFFEWKQNEQTASCLVIGENEEADALTSLLKTRCRETDRIPESEKTYDIIFLTEGCDIHLLRNMADRETLVVDAAVSKEIRYFDPSLPFRQVRVISLSLAE